MEDPTVPELIRDLQADLRGVGDDVREMKDAQAALVTKELHSAEMTEVKRRLDVLENGRRALVTLLAFPVIVGLVVWYLTEGRK